MLGCTYIEIYMLLYIHLVIEVWMLGMYLHAGVHGGMYLEMYMLGCAWIHDGVIVGIMTVNIFSLNSFYLCQ